MQASVCCHRPCGLAPQRRRLAPARSCAGALAELDASGPERKVVVAQVAPAVRVAIAEAVGLQPGDVGTGHLVAGLRAIGFDYVFDTLVGADLTIIEEGHELLHRLQSAPRRQPMFTSCCPGWIALVEKSNPELIPFLSTCKSPQLMLGAVIKNWFARTVGRAPEDVSCVSIMPCVRKQSEADRSRDVDHVVTTTELGKVFLDRGVRLRDLPESAFDSPLGVGSGGAQLFGTTGGVMEAALRTVYEVVTETPMERLAYADVRGLEGVKESTLVLKPGPSFAQFGDALELRVAVANGLGNAKKLIKAMADGAKTYDFVEVMACPGGCVGGGGQPRSADKQVLAKRQAALYDLDERNALRRPHENPQAQVLYAEFLGEPNGPVAHELLHTHYYPDRD
jgi:iron-only hydrogenase group A